jgi:hypothetical protein
MMEAKDKTADEVLEPQSYFKGLSTDIEVN